MNKNLLLAIAGCGFIFAVTGIAAWVERPEMPAETPTETTAYIARDVGCVTVFHPVGGSGDPSFSACPSELPADWNRQMVPLGTRPSDIMFAPPFTS